MTEREFWIAVRSALLAIVKAIEVKYKLGRFAKGELIELREGETVTWSLSNDD